jgi:two-component system chemotaxis response regulator CheY
MKILVVDDEPVSRRMLERIMQTFGDCSSVASGGEAIAAFEAAWASWAPFDLITLDVSMPEMDGTETLSQIRQRENAKHVPNDKRVKVVMVTARSDKPTVLTAIQAGCNDYITKPLQRETIAKKLARLWVPWGQPLVRTAMSR